MSDAPEPENNVAVAVPVILTPALNVDNPTESILVTSSYVKTPPTLTAPLNFASPTTSNVDTGF